MEPDPAVRLVDAWVERHVTVEPPSPDATQAVREALALVPDPEAAAAITGPDGRPQIVALAGGALYAVWAVRGSASVREAARCRRIPLRPVAPGSWRWDTSTGVASGRSGMRRQRAASRTLAEPWTAHTT
jgi:hypothetical protein